MRNIHADLKTAQESLTAIPYIKLTIDGTDYGTDNTDNPLVSHEWIEEPYRDRAIIVIDNSNRGLDLPDTPFTGNDLRGKPFFIGEGYICSGDVKRYLGDGLVGGENPAPPTLWVKTQHITSVEGKVVCILTCEGMWTKLREMRFLVTAVNIITIPFQPLGYINCIASDIGKQVKDDGAEVGQLLLYDNELRKWWIKYDGTIANGSVIVITSGTGSGATNLDSEAQEQDDPYYSVKIGGTQTIKEIISLALAQAGMTLNATFEDDGIIDTLKPFFTVNTFSLPNLSAVIYELIKMTKTYLRPEASLVHKLIYPQDADAVKETYYSDRAPYFKEYVEKRNLLIPNEIIVYWGINADGTWDTSKLDDPGTAVDQGSIDAYERITLVVDARELTLKADATLRAEAILQRLKSEELAGRVVLPYHDCEVELYDKVQAIDKRGT